MIVPSYLAFQSGASGDSVLFLRLPEDYYIKHSNELERKVCLFYRSDDFLSNLELAFVDSCMDAVLNMNIKI